MQIRLQIQCGGVRLSAVGYRGIRKIAVGCITVGYGTIRYGGALCDTRNMVEHAGVPWCTVGYMVYVGYGAPRLDMVEYGRLRLRTVDYGGVR